MIPQMQDKQIPNVKGEECKITLNIFIIGCFFFFFVYMLDLKVAEKKSGWIHSGLC